MLSAVDVVVMATFSGVGTFVMPNVIRPVKPEMRAALTNVVLDVPGATEIVAEPGTSVNRFSVDAGPDGSSEQAIERSATTTSRGVRRKGNRNMIHLSGWADDGREDSVGR